MKLLLGCGILLQLMMPAYAQRGKPFPIALTRVQHFNSFWSYKPVALLNTNVKAYKLPPGVDQGYLIKLFDLQPMQTLYSDYLAGLVTKAELEEEAQFRHVDTLSLSRKPVGSSMGILIYRKGGSRCYIFDTDHNMDFTNDKIFAFSEDSLKSNPGNFKAAIKISTVLEEFYEGKRYRKRRDLFFHPADCGGIKYDDPVEQSLYIIASADIIYQGRLPDGGYMYFGNDLPVFLKLARFYAGTMDSIDATKSTVLKRTLKSKTASYRIDSVAPDLSRAWISPLSLDGTAADVGFMAPLFNFDDTKGNKISTEAMRGKYVLMDFTGSWCPSCVAALPGLQIIYNTYSDKMPFAMISVSVERDDNRARFDSFLSKHDMPWNVIYKPTKGREIMDLNRVDFMVQVYPTYFILNKEGRIVFRESGNDALDKIKEFLAGVNKE